MTLCTAAIPGLPDEATNKLLQQLTACPAVEAVWLYGSRAMGREQPGSDIDLCLVGDALSHNDRLRLLAAVDDLLLPWQVDLSLHQELPTELLAHVQRVGSHPLQLGQHVVSAANRHRADAGSEAGAFRRW